MRKYYLASNMARWDVDLRDYTSIITEAVHTFMPKAVVTVCQDYYCVSPTPRQGDAVKIGRKICESELKNSCIYIPKLFCSREATRQEVIANGKQKNRKSMGGHH